MISQNIPIYILLWLPCILAATYNYTGILQGSQTFKVFTYPVPTGYNIASIQFKVYNTYYSNVVILPSFTNNSQNLDTYRINSLIISDDPILKQMDVISAIGGNSQIINMQIPTPYPSAIYITLYNFDFPEVNTTKFFYTTLRFNLNIVVCRYCSGGTKIQKEHLEDLSCQCTTCGTNRVGVSCQYTLNPLDPDGSQKIDVFESKDIYYIIKNTGSPIRLSLLDIRGTGNIIMYMQYQYRWGLIAGKLNNHYINETMPQIFTFQPSETTVQIGNLQNNDILLTVKNLGTSLGTVKIRYISQSSKTSDSLTLVFAIVFGLIGAAVIFLIILKIVNCYRSRNTIVIHLNHNNLTSQQIDKYFPQVKATSLIRPSSDLLTSEDSISDLNQQNYTLIMYKHQCSICYENIKVEDLIRVTYCRHIFHSKCLAQWFSKSQNCPNCRMSSQFEQTKNQRKVLSREEKKRPQILVRAILGSKFLEQLRANGLVKKEEQKKEVDKFDEKDFQIEEDKKTEKENEAKQEQS